MVPVHTVTARSRQSENSTQPTQPLVAAAGLLGREGEISRVAGALELSQLVTLTGAPGIGKTRLALAVATAAGRRDGSAMVELASVHDQALVPAAVASTLGVSEAPGQRPTETIVAALRRRRLLLVLDNCEHVLGACAQIVGDLLAACPDVHVLATSREPLGLQGERVWRVPPLPVPEPGEAGPEALMEYPAVALFVERAGEVQRGFALNAFLAADVAEICRRLEGIPLAIELAAARVGTLTPGEIARRLEDRLGLLSNGSRSRLGRHRTLAAALDWSHALLSAPERMLLCRLSVFAGRFELDAAEAICAGEEVDPPGVSELLGRLVSKSLLVADADSGAPVRYRLLETVRAYAGEKLEQAGGVAELRTAHAHFYMTLAERAEPELAGPGLLQWLDRLEAERANLRAALEWSLGHGRSEWALRLAGALVLFWRVRCHFTEGRELLDAVLSASQDDAPALRARALWGAGFLTLMAGDVISASPLLEESLARFRGLGDSRGCARALLVLANARQLLQDASVLPLLEESARLAREAGDSWCLAHALGVAGFECYGHDELRHAREFLEECLAVAREAGDAQGVRFGLIGLGPVAVAQGDYREAESLLEEAVQATSALGEDYDKAKALTYLAALALGRGEYPRARELLDNALTLIPEIAPQGARLESFVLLARVAHAQGDHLEARCLLETVLAIGGNGAWLLQARAQLALDEGDAEGSRRLFEEARELARARGEKGNLAGALHGLGQIARSEGDPERSAALHFKALEIQGEAGELPGLADSLEALAGLAAGAGHLHHAARLFGAAKALRERGGYARKPWESARYEADLALTCRSLPTEELARALAHGEALSLDQALAEASEGPRPARAASGWPSLTERELQVAQLVADGLTNPEIAERLIIARETVKTHLSHIFAKLSVTGRWALAREVRSRSGGPP